ncbi:MAG: hypothetical protein WD049_03335 [Candidatus Paceibacterota bacterium]
MRYSTDVKRTVMEKLLRPDGPGVPAMSVEFGIPTGTLYNWASRARNGSMSRNRKMSGKRTLGEKMTFVLEGRGLPDEKLGLWLREKGIHEDQLKVWEQEIDTALIEHEKQPARENEYRQHLKELERDLRRKEKALAEMTAIAVLKKKLEAMWEEPAR